MLSRSLVILSEAKNPFHSALSVLRFAQNDNIRPFFISLLKNYPIPCSRCVPNARIA